MTDETMDPQAHVDRTIADLQAAITWLEVHNWIQGDSFEYQADYEVNAWKVAQNRPDASKIIGACMWGAIRIVTGDLNRPLMEQNRAPLAGRAFRRAISEDMVAYNDAEGRTKGDCLRALEITIEGLRRDPSRA